MIELLDSHKNFMKVLMCTVLLLGSVPSLQAQRFGHGASRGGGRTMAHSPSRSMNRSTTPATRNRSINGGHQTSTNRSFSNSNKRSTANNRTATTGRTTRSNQSNSRTKTSNNRTGNRHTSNIKTKDRNKVNVDRSRGDVNINVDNSRHVNVRNTQVRRSGVAYVRPPVIYGGFHFYCHAPYFYHPYVPFYWGPYYHPWGYFVTSLATTAIVVSIIHENEESKEEEYHYDNGTYYLKTEDGFEAVQAPVGAQVPSLPKEAETVTVNETTNNYYYGGAFYEKNADGYVVVPATAGTIVPNLPEGGEEVKVGDVTYVQFGDTYYQPVQIDGKDMYEIVEVRDAE